MEDLEKKISELLSSPDSMAQLMAMARALSGGEDTTPGDPEQAAPAAEAASAMGPAPPKPEHTEAGNFDLPDPQTMAKLMGIMRRMSAPQDKKKTALLNALRPYLSAQRQQKLDRALKMIQMTEAAKLALGEFQGGDSLV